MMDRCQSMYWRFRAPDALVGEQRRRKPYHSLGGPLDFAQGKLRPPLQIQKMPGPMMVPTWSWLVARIKLLATEAKAPYICNSYAALQADLPRYRLRPSARSHRQIPHLGQDARHLHPVQLRY